MHGISVHEAIRPERSGRRPGRPTIRITRSLCAIAQAPGAAGRPTSRWSACRADSPAG